MAANLNKKVYQKKKIKLQKIQHGGLRVQNKNKLRVRGPADPLCGSQNSASHLHKIPRIWLTYTLLYRNIAKSCSNIDIRIVGKISRFTNASVYRCSPTDLVLSIISFLFFENPKFRANYMSWDGP